MKRSIRLLLFFTLLLAAQLLPAQSDKEKAIQLAYQAIAKMDKGEVDESITLLKEAQKLYPEDFDIPYELAYAYYLKEDYKTTISILEPLAKHKDVSERYFQLLGNSHDMLKDSDKAMEVYRSGLKKFPNSGILYLEQGNVHWAKEEYIEALPYYEKGIQVDPAFPSNYFRAAKVYCASTEPIWGVLYAEIFMNLERNSARTAEISELLYKTYQSSIHIESGSSGGVSFSKVMVMDADKKFKIPFQMVFGANMAASLGIQMISKEKELTLTGIDNIRKNFIDFWFDQHREKEYPNMLFDYNQEVVKSGNFEAYNHWIFMKGDEEAFTAWQAANGEKWDKFVAWFSKNPLKLSKKEFFYREQYN